MSRRGRFPTIGAARGGGRADSKHLAPKRRRATNSNSKGKGQGQLTHAMRTSARTPLRRTGLGVT